MSSGHIHSYEMWVSASSAEEAIEIVAEGLPRGADQISAEALEILKTPGTWQVKIRYQGGKRASSDFLA